MLNPTELEAKMRLPDPSAVTARLGSIAGAMQSDVIETNTFFDTAENSLQSQDRGLRIRTVRDAVTGVAGRSVLTYKGPRQPGDLKHRHEAELIGVNPDEAQSILGLLGYFPTLTFEKRRKTWQVDGCEVVLDELPRVGFYLEIEGPNRQAILELRDRLGLRSSPLLRESYAQIVAEHVRRNPGEKMRFDPAP